MDILEIFDTMKKKFNKEKVTEATTYYFTFGPKEQDKWTLFIDKEGYRFEQGKKVDNADCVLKCTVDFFTKLVLEGYMPGMTDILSGKIKTNNPNLLKKLRIYFS